MVDHEFRRLHKMEQERKRLISQHKREIRRAENPNFFSESVNLDRYLVARRERVRQSHIRKQVAKEERRTQISKRRNVRQQIKQQRAKKLAALHLRVTHKLFGSRNN
jgi:hypothetical protein